MENTQERETERIEAAPDQGLSRSQVAHRIAAGLDHKKNRREDKILWPYFQG